jgi:hypothetical protein
MVQGNHFSKLSAFVAVAEHGAAPQKRCSIRPVAQPGPTEDQMISPQPRSAPTRPDLSLVSSHQSVQNLRKRQLVHIVHDSARDDVAAAPSNPPPRAPAPPDEMPVRSLCPRMVCTACGLVGADVRPDWSPHTNRRPTSTRSRAVDCLPRGRDDRRPRLLGPSATSAIAATWPQSGSSIRAFALGERDVRVARRRGAPGRANR